MHIEIERKYLVVSDAWRAAASPGVAYRQGYLAKSRDKTVRVRRDEHGATLTVKSARSGIVRIEFTCPIALEDADYILRHLCADRVLEKVRHLVMCDSMLWHVDVYAGPAAGLVVAEIELEEVDQAFALPAWVGAEVTHNPRYRNSRIALRCAGGLNGRRAKIAGPASALGAARLGG